MKKVLILLLVCLVVMLTCAAAGAQLSVGQRYSFGSYEQGSGKSPISWLVLKTEGKKALLLSESILDEQPYHSSWGDVTWETSSLRRWLNSTFYNAAFSSSEKSRIVEVTNSNPAVSGTDHGYYFYTDGGRDTKDKVFLLSIDEANDFYRHFHAWRCYSTPYVFKKGGYAADVNIGPVWWLRSPGSAQNCASMVSGDGILTNCFEPAVTITIGVRPAVWITF